MNIVHLAMIIVAGILLVLPANVIHAQSNQYPHGIGSNSSALYNSVGLTYQQCQDRISNELQKTTDSLDRGKAVALALTSPDFQAKASGHKYELTDISTNDTWDNSLCGNVKRTAVGVSFNLLDTPNTYLESVNVAEDANMSKVAEVGTETTPICNNNCGMPAIPPIGNSFTPDISSDFHFNGIMVPNGTMPVSIDLSNQGNLTLYNVHVEFVDSPLLDSFRTGYGNFTLQAGQEKTVLGTISLPSVISNVPSSLYWMVYSNNQEDATGPKEFHKTINLADKHTWMDNSVSFRTVLPPLKQGGPVNYIECRQGLDLIIKSDDYSPACVTPSTNQTLIERGWGESISNLIQPPLIKEMQIDGLQQNYKISQPINATIRYIGWSASILPDIKIFDANGSQVWFNCPECVMRTELARTEPAIQYPGFFDTFHYKIQDPNGYPPIINKTGTYTIVASLENKTVQATFVVTRQTSEPSSALKIYLSTTSQTIQPGQPIGITISVNNTLSQPVTLSDENSWKVNYLRVNPCTIEPYGIAILDGFYSEQNVTEGTPLAIFNFDANCPSYNKVNQTYVFDPSSGHTTLSICTDTMSCASSNFDMGSRLSFSGLWKDGQIQPFNPGMYTVVGGDEWGHLSIEHFVVSNSTIFAGDLGPISCPVIYGGGMQFTANVKNFTGFANYYNSSQYGQTFVLHPGMKGTVTVQYSAPANAAWFQNNDNAPFNMTNGAALFYVENVTKNKSTISYAASLDTDKTGHHSQICHYHMPYGGFEEPCNTDNTGDIPLSELPDASKVLHVGIDTSYAPNSVMLYPNTSPVFTGTVSANSDAKPGIYWLSLQWSLCGPGVLAKLVVLP